MAYPLFSNAIKSSTPFSGTLADTSTPTPAGTEPQEPQMGPAEKPQFQMPQAPQATEAPGAAGDRERLQKIQEDRSQIQQQLHFLATARWVNQNHWSRRMNLALTGNDMEPAGMMYKRYGAMSDLLKIDAQLAEEARLITTPSAQEQQDISDASSRDRRQKMVDQVNQFHKAMGLPDVEPELAVGFVEKGYPLQYAPKSGSGTDEATQMIADILKGITIGRGVGKTGVPNLPLKGPALIAALDAAKQKALEEATKEGAKNAPKPLPVLGQFEKPADLFKAMQDTYDNVVKADKYTTWTEKKTTDFAGMDQTRLVPEHTPDQLRDARAETVTHFPGYEKYFPSYVEKGFTDVPAISPEQGDVSPEAARMGLAEWQKALMEKNKKPAAKSK